MQITERLYGYTWRGSGNNCNTYLFVGEKTILIDPGHIQNELGERCLERLLAGPVSYTHLLYLSPAAIPVVIAVMAVLLFLLRDSNAAAAIGLSLIHI